jgi:hypothetical protein
MKKNTNKGSHKKAGKTLHTAKTVNTTLKTTAIDNRGGKTKHNTRATETLTPTGVRTKQGTKFGKTFFSGTTHAEDKKAENRVPSARATTSRPSFRNELKGKDSLHRPGTRPIHVKSSHG